MVASVFSADADLTGIIAALKARDFQTALQLTRQRLTSEPNDVKLQTFEGLALEGLGREDEALAVFESALASSADYLPALEAKAQIEYRERKPQAAQTLTRIIALKPDDQIAHAMLAALSYQAGNCQAVIANYQQSQQVISSQTSALNQYGRCLVKTGDVAHAASVFERITVIEPSSDQAKYNLALVCLINKDPQESLQTLQRIGGTTELPHSALLRLSSAAYEMLGNTPRAVEDLRAAILQDPRDVDLYIDFVSLCLDHRSYQVALDFINTGLKEIPNNARLYVARGIVYVQMGDYESAVKDFDTGERLDPVHSFGSMAKGLSQMQESKLDQSLATTETEIHRHPDDPFLQYLKAETLRRQGVRPRTPAFAEALEAASRAVSLNSHFTLAQDLLGVLYLQAGQNEVAIRAFQAALADDPRNQPALYHLLTAARKAGKTALAEDLVKRLAEAKQQAKDEDVRASRYRILAGAESASSIRR